MPLPKIPYDPWFHEPHPHDSMPIARDYDNPRPEEEIADDFGEVAEEVVTMHEKMYRIATSKYNPFSVGGSENIHDFE